MGFTSTGQSHLGCTLYLQKHDNFGDGIGQVSPTNVIGFVDKSLLSIMPGSVN